MRHVRGVKTSRPKPFFPFTSFVQAGPVHSIEMGTLVARLGRLPLILDPAAP